jgi:drug/metabolite transporter (DMT)-like permease
MLLLPAFLTTVLFSISAVTANRLAKMLGGIAANFWRITVATMLLAAWAHTAGAGMTGEAFPIFLLSGCIGFGIGDIALYQALPRIGSRLSVMLVHCLAAPFAAFVEWLWLGTRLTGPQIAWSLTILLGISLALAPSEHLAITRRALIVGVIFGVLAAFGQGFGAVLSRKAYQIASQSGESIDGLSAAYQRILAGWIVAALSLIVAKQVGRWSKRAAADASVLDKKLDRKQASTWIFVNALSGPTLGVGCYQWALSTMPTGIVLPIVALTPLVVIPFVRVMEGERPTARSLVGSAIAVVGAAALTLVKP